MTTARGALASAEDVGPTEGNPMTSGPEQEHLDHRHRDTLHQIFQHPTSHNIEWHAVLSLRARTSTRRWWLTCAGC
jgi:hypothetical protein